MLIDTFILAENITFSSILMTLVRELLELSKEDKLQAAMDFLILILSLSCLILSGSYWSCPRRTSNRPQWTFLSLSYLYLVLSYQGATGAIRGGQTTGRNGRGRGGLLHP